MGSFLVWFSHAPATTHPNCSLSSLLLLYGLQGQCKRRVLFAAFLYAFNEDKTGERTN